MSGPNSNDNASRRFRLNSPARGWLDAVAGGIEAQFRQVDALFPRYAPRHWPDQRNAGASAVQRRQGDPKLGTPSEWVRPPLARFRQHRVQDPVERHTNDSVSPPSSRDGPCGAVSRHALSVPRRTGSAARARDQRRCAGQGKSGERHATCLGRARDALSRDRVRFDVRLAPTSRLSRDRPGVGACREATRGAVLASP